MSDRYLCKAKRTDNGEWVEGDLIHEPYGTVIQYYEKKGDYKKRIRAKVDPETLCQCPGYKGIWEHDIFQCDEDRYQIEYDEVYLTWQAISIFSSESIELGEFHPEEIDVIGNIFNNPELLDCD